MSNVIVKLELNKVLATLLGSSRYVDQWWDSPNRAFDYKSPNQVYWESDEGRALVAEYIYQYAESAGS